jgi:hypothetical protein
MGPLSNKFSSLLIVALLQSGEIPLCFPEQHPASIIFRFAPAWSLRSCCRAHSAAFFAAIAGVRDCVGIRLASMYNPFGPGNCLVDPTLRIADHYIFI